MIKESLFATGADKICVRVYVFGSYLYSENPSDLDLLFIYMPLDKLSYSLAIKFRNIFYDTLHAQLKFSADVILLTVDEVEELDYLNKINGELIFP